MNFGLVRVDVLLLLLFIFGFCFLLGLLFLILYFKNNKNAKWKSASKWFYGIDIGCMCICAILFFVFRSLWFESPIDATDDLRQRMSDIKSDITGSDVYIDVNSEPDEFSKEVSANFEEYDDMSFVGCDVSESDELSPYWIGEYLSDDISHSKYTTLFFDNENHIFKLYNVSNYDTNLSFDDNIHDFTVDNRDSFRPCVVNDYFLYEYTMGDDGVYHSVFDASVVISQDDYDAYLLRNKSAEDSYDYVEGTWQIRDNRVILWINDVEVGSLSKYSFDNSDLSSGEGISNLISDGMRGYIWTDMSH